MGLIAGKLSRDASRVEESKKKLNIDFGKQSMPATSIKKEIKKSVPVSTSVFKLDREAQLPTIFVEIAKISIKKEKSKRTKKNTDVGEEEETKCFSKVFGPIGKNPVAKPNSERLQKLLAEFPQRTKPKKKETEATCFTATQWQSTFNKLTGFNIEIP